MMQVSLEMSDFDNVSLNSEPLIDNFLCQTDLCIHMTCILYYLLQYQCGRVGGRPTSLAMGRSKPRYLSTGMGGPSVPSARRQRNQCSSIHWRKFPSKLWYTYFSVWELHLFLHWLLVSIYKVGSIHWTKFPSKLWYTYFSVGCADFWFPSTTSSLPRKAPLFAAPTTGFHLQCRHRVRKPCLLLH